MPGSVLEEIFGEEQKTSQEREISSGGSGLLDEIFQTELESTLDQARVAQFDEQLASTMPETNDDWKLNQNASTVQLLEPFAENKALASTEEASTLEEWRLNYGQMRGESGEITAPINHLGEELPEGAVGWDWNGEAFYGSGLSGWWNKVVSKFNAPVSRKEVASDLPVFVYNYANPGRSGGHQLVTKSFNLRNALQNLSGKLTKGTQEGEEMSKASAIAGATLKIRRAADILIMDTALPALSYPAKLAEQALGAAEGLKEAAGNTVTFDIDNDQTPDWYENIIENLYNINPGTIAYNAARTLVSSNSFDEKWDKIEKGWIAGNVQYSGLFEPALKEEYVRRYMAGADPALLTVELENPMAEMVGQMIVDPLNLVDLGVGSLGKSGRIEKVAKVANSVPVEIDDILKAARASTDPEGLRALKNTSQAILTYTDKVRQGMSDLAQSTGLFNPLANTKRGRVLGKTAETLAVLSSTTDNAEDVVGMYGTLAKLASSSLDEVSQGIAEASHYGKNVRNFLTERAFEAGVMLRKIIGETEDGALDVAGFMSAFKNYQKKAVDALEDGQDALSAQAYMGQMLGDRLTKAVDEMFPKAVDIKNLPYHLKPIARLNETISKIYKPVNSFFAGVYFSSPGFAFRNLANNFFTTAIDEGLGTAVSIFDPKNNQRVVGELMGDMAVELMRSMRGFGGGMAKAADVDTKWWTLGVKMSEKMEEWTAAAITRRTVVDTFNKMMTRGRGIPALDHIIARGLAPEAADQLYDMIRANKYNVKAALAQFKEAASTGSIDRVTNLEKILSREVMVKLGEWGAEEKVREALAAVTARGGTPEEALAEIEKIRKAVLKPADGVVDEAVAVPQEAFQAEDIPFIDQHADIPAELKELNVDRIGANHVARQSNWAVINMVDEALSKAIALGDFSLVRSIDDVKQYILKRATDVTRVSGDEDRAFSLAAHPYIENLEHQATKQKKNFNAPKEWNRLEAMAKAKGITLTRPQELNYKTIKKVFWEQYWYPVKAKIGLDGVKKLATVADEAAARLKKIKIEMPTLEQVITQAKIDTAAAEAWAHSVPNEVIRFQLNDLRDAGDQAGIVRLLAKKYHISTATDEGVPLDGKLLDIINKHLPEKGKFKALAEIPEAVAEEQLRNYHMANYFKSKGLEYKPFVSGLVENAEDEAALAAQKAVMAEAPQPNAKIPKPYAGGVPSPARVTYEQRAGVNKIFKALNNAVQQNWGITDNIVINNEIDDMLEAWGKEVEANVIATRMVASQYAYEARKFTLLDYTEKYGWDAALQLAMPYEFWYTRSYANWAKRVVTNPGVISEYALYKQGLAKIHADLPEWFRYNISSNEIPGVNLETPLYFNLEATLWPLNGITGVDFEDPNRRVNWWTTAIDDMTKFGPSLWTPYNAAIALAMMAQGEEEAAAAWGGRLIPQTAPLKAALALTNTKIRVPGGGLNEFDPFVNFFAGGLDPYERRRVGRAIERMLANNEITKAQAAEALYTQKGELWNEGIIRATKLRAPGQISSFLFGVGFKGRTPEDIEIERMDTERKILMAKKETMTPEQYRQGWLELEKKYPYLDYVVMSRKSGQARDEAYAYMVLDRIPPGQMSDLLDVAGISTELSEKFMNNKGFDNWSKIDQENFMMAIMKLGAALDAPDDATQEEWNAAKENYRRMNEEIKKQYGDNILNVIDYYFELRNRDSNKAKAFIASKPELSEALNAQKRVIMGDRLLNKYYGDMSKIESYFKSQMYDYLEKQYPNIQPILDEYEMISDEKERKKFYKEHPEIGEYYDFRDSIADVVYNRLTEIGNIFRNGPPQPLVREDADQTSTVVRELIAGVQRQQEPTLYDYSLDQWRGEFNEYQWRLMEDYMQNGEEMGEAMENKVNRIAAKYGIDDRFLLALIRKQMIGQ